MLHLVGLPPASLPCWLSKTSELSLPTAIALYGWSRRVRNCWPLLVELFGKRGRMIRGPCRKSVLQYWHDHVQGRRRAVILGAMAMKFRAFEDSRPLLRFLGLC